MSSTDRNRYRIAYFASGTGQLFEACVSYFQQLRPPSIDNIALFTDCAEGPLLFRAERLGVPISAVSPKSKDFASRLVAQLSDLSPDLIVLVGFKYKIPAEAVTAFAGKMINSHPSLLPNFGGPGMYGKRVHEAVFRSGAQRSGFTLHEVTTEIDQGPILMQSAVDVSRAQTAAEIEELVKSHERKELPMAILKLLELRPIPHDSMSSQRKN